MRFEPPIFSIFVGGAILMEKKRTEDLMEMLGLKETVVQMAKVNEIGRASCRERV